MLPVKPAVVHTYKYVSMIYPEPSAPSSGNNPVSPKAAKIVTVPGIFPPNFVPAGNKIPPELEEMDASPTVNELGPT